MVEWPSGGGHCLGRMPCARIIASGFLTLLLAKEFLDLRSRTGSDTGELPIKC